jgi:arginase
MSWLEPLGLFQPCVPGNSVKVKMARVAVLDAPSILGLRPSGVERLPEALRQAGLIDRLHARDAGRIAPQTPYDTTRDPTTLTLNATGIVGFSRTLADAVGDVLDRGEFPLVLGGDCSILLGNLLALKRRGRYGLLFVDGHADFYSPEANPNGEAASMDLALATGRGPEVLTNIEGRRPLVKDEDVVAFGFRDTEEQATFGSPPFPQEILACDQPTIRRKGVAAASREAVAHLTRREASTNGFWIHVDADVLDDEIMPAVDYRLPDGLSWEELTQALHIAIETGQAVGMEVTIYNPTLDPERAGAQGLTRVIVDTLTARL